ncbi:MAG: hypothetical protein VKO39_02725 [Cyanobacteriota bacterium]|nr:hypothetical protein [Cyanobacteriota bacterium]
MSKELLIKELAIKELLVRGWLIGELLIKVLLISALLAKALSLSALAVRMRGCMNDLSRANLSRIAAQAPHRPGFVYSTRPSLKSQQTDS